VHKEDNKLEEMELELGTLLKKARQEKGLSLDDIQEETKIRKKYLEAIEENNFDILPGNVYLKVFIKGYAREVDINYQALLENYPILNIKEEKESNLQKDYLNGTKVSSSNQNHNKKNPLKIIFIILLLLFLGAAAVYTYQYVNNSEIRLLNQQNSIQENIEEESELLEVENNDDSASAAEEDEEEIDKENAVNSEEDLDSSLRIFNDDSFENELTDNLFDSFDSDILTEENTEIIEQNNFQELNGLNSQEQNQINEIIISEKTESKESGKERNDSAAVDVESEVEEEEVQNTERTQLDANESETAAGSVEEETVADFDNTLLFSAADTVWVSVDLDGENVFSGILEDGDQREFEVDQRLYIKIGNGNAITAKINGEVYGPWAGNGEIAEVEFINQDQEIRINNLRD
jgi:cytoskeletal protein RodZ